MTWTGVPESLAAAHPRFRELCDEDNPDVKGRDAYRAMVLRLAQGGDTPAYPPLREQAVNLGKAMAGFAADRFRTVDAAERARRLALCRACEYHDPAAARCRLCGCSTLKARIAGSHCPLSPPKW